MDQDVIGRVVDDVVALHAAEVDATGTFPVKSIEALRDAGLLGLTTSAEMGGGGGGLADAVTVIERISGVCGSTAMVLLMHYAATAIIEAHGADDARRRVGAGDNLTTLAFSEVASRSHFWAPAGTATIDGDHVRLDASKSWVTSAAHADTYVWSSRPHAAGGPMTLWLVPAGVGGLAIGERFDGLGLRGNGSVPVTASGVLVERDAQLGADGDGLDIALATALPWFLVLSAAFAVGLMQRVTDEASTHLTTARLEHLDSALIDQPIARRGMGRMRLVTDASRAFVGATLAALADGRDDAVVHVLETKAMAAESAIEVTDIAMTLCGGAAFRKELGIERCFRDARAARVMAPTTDALLDFVGRAATGRPLLDA